MTSTSPADAATGHSPCDSPVQVLERTGIAFTLHEHVPIRTQSDIERELGLPVEQLLKTMVFRTEETFILAALPMERRVHYGRLAKAAGVPRASLRQAEPEDLRELAMEPGGASPVCGRADVLVIFDSAVLEMDRVHCGSGRPEQSIEIDVQELLRFLDPVLAAVTS
ncbi:Cys-tRNA(Pro)/Cys-tRNA(Cys) deacylase [Streptacidiphilus sp. MAP12-33]|uniref:aminoacyl-tRNA deacylase n=1 Tax=Streptacidiphilus sp. MAP12-33 TaxID=3156266 RepID=UPI003519915E